MYELKTYNENSYKMYQLQNTNTNSWITVCPERGGILISYGINGQELLYLNKETLYDRRKNVRGGIPILFPISGQLINGHYEWGGKRYVMPNHGLARIKPWKVVDEKLEEYKASITIGLFSNDETKNAYPFDFEVLFTYILDGEKLIIEQSYRNMTKEVMPIYAGLHPYFKSRTKMVSLETDATTYLDYNDNEVKDLRREIDMEDKQESIVLLNAKQKTLSMNLDQKRIVMKTSDDFLYTVLWTEKGQDFICLEPWMAKTGELERGDELTLIPANEALNTSVEFEITDY